MTGSLAKDGVRLVVEGAKKFISTLGKVSSAWAKTVGGFIKGAGAIGSAVTGLGVFAFGVGKSVQAMARLVAGVGSLATESSKLQGISVQFANLTQNIEGGSKAMLQALQEASGGMISTRDLMQKFSSATSLVSEDFAKRLPEALGLLSKANVATGKSMDFLFDRLVRGIGRSSPLLLDDLEIQVGLAESTAFAAEMYGREADALSEAEKQAALYELTLIKLKEAYGALPDTTQSAAAQSAILNANLQNLRDTVGMYIIPGWTSLLTSINRVVGAFSEAISEGGALEGVMIRIGATLSILADGAASFADFFVNTFSDVGDEMSNNIAGTIEQALRWGVELISAFAEGIVEATSTVLIQAMQFLSNVMTKWLLGESPPKIAPGIVDWGINLMGMYLKGMTQADFGILKGIQGPLQKILSGPEFANVSKALAEALAGGDRESFIDIVGQAAGIFGESIGKLAQLNFELADSVKAVEDAEKALTDARTKVTDSQGAVNEQTAEYNRLLRAGASREVLDAQLARINAAEDAREKAVDQVDVEEEALKQAKERKKQLEAEQKLQRDLVNQLMAINAALREQQQAREEGDGGDGLLGIPSGEDLASRIGAAIDKMKAQLKEKFADIFAPLSEAWDEIIKDIENLSAAWDKFALTVGNAWDKLKEKYPFLEELEKAVVDMPGAIEEIGTVWGGVADLVIIAWDELKKRYPMLQDIENVLANFPAHSKQVWTDFQTYLTPAFEEVKKAASDLWDTLKDDLWPWIRDTLWPKLYEFGNTVLWGVADAFGAIVKAIRDLSAAISDIITTGNWDKFVKILFPFIGKSPSPLEKGLKGVNQQLQTMTTMRMPALASMGQAGSAMMPRPMAGSMTNNSVIINNGGNTINGGMEMAGFQSGVERIVRNALRR